MGWTATWHHTEMQAIQSGRRVSFKQTKNIYEREQQIIVNGAEAMQHHVGLSWIYKLHTYNITLIKWADYKTLKELWSSKKPNISHLRVFGCLAWVHILKKRRHTLEPKNQEMIFIGYKQGWKGYMFWDTAHWCFEISHDVKFAETHFPAKEMTLIQPGPAQERFHQVLKSDTESNSLGLNLVKLAQPPTRPPSPGQSAPRQPAIPPQNPMFPPALPPVPRENIWNYLAWRLLYYSPQHLNTHCDPSRIDHNKEVKLVSPLIVSATFWYTCFRTPQILLGSHEFMDKDKWLRASMGIWKLVDHPSNHKTIKCRWTYMLKSDGHYKARLITKGYTQVQGID